MLICIQALQQNIGDSVLAIRCVGIAGLYFGTRKSSVSLLHQQVLYITFVVLKEELSFFSSVSILLLLHGCLGTVIL